jgi:hypothetical protein
MKGVQFVVDERGQKTAVVIDLRRHAAVRPARLSAGVSPFNSDRSGDFTPVGKG